MFLKLRFSCLDRSVEAAGIRQYKEWDFLVFTQHWPATTCLQWKSEGKGHTCVLPKKPTWTVHGVWYVVF